MSEGNDTPTPSYPVTSVTSVTYNQEIADFIHKEEGYKGYTGYWLLASQVPISRKDLSQKTGADENAIDKSFIDSIADICVKKRRGDCRVAIESVFYSAQNAEADKRNVIIEEDVKKALKLAIDQSDKVLVQKLRDNQLLILYILCNTNHKRLEDIHENYTNILKSDKFKIFSKSPKFTYKKN